MNLQCFKVTIQDGWALLEMARPDRLNILDETVLLELESILRIFKEERIKAIVLTGQGKAFAAGGCYGQNG